MAARNCEKMVEFGFERHDSFASFCSGIGLLFDNIGSLDTNLSFVEPYPSSNLVEFDLNPPPKQKSGISPQNSQTLGTLTPPNFLGFRLLANSTAALKKNYLIARLQKGDNNNLKMKFAGEEIVVNTTTNRKRKLEDKKDLVQKWTLGDKADLSLRFSFVQDDENPVHVVARITAKKIKATGVSSSGKRETLIIQNDGQVIQSEEMTIISKRRNWDDTLNSVSYFMEAQKRLEAFFSLNAGPLESAEVDTFLRWVKANRDEIKAEEDLLQPVHGRRNCKKQKIA